MTKRKILKAHKRRKDFLKKKHIVRQQYAEIANTRKLGSYGRRGKTRKGFSISFPESRKYAKVL